jgi:YVTN family beta-propeller protein
MRPIRSLPIPIVLLAALAAPVRAGAETLVVLNKAEASASLLDPATGSLAATLPTGVGPHEGDVSPDGRLVLVTNYGTEQAGSSLTVLDLPAAAVVKTIELGEYRRPHGVRWLSDGRRALVTAEQNEALLIVDVEAGAVEKALPTGQKVSHMVAVTPDEKRAFVANIGSGSISAFDLETGERLGIIETGAGAEGIDVTPDGAQVWVSNRAADTVSVVDATTLQVIEQLESASFPIRVRVTPDGRHVLVSNARSGDVSVFDAKERKLVRRVPMQLEAGSAEGRAIDFGFGESPVPIGILIPPDGKRAFVANAQADAIAVVDLGSWKVTGLLKGGREPDGMAWSPLASASEP